MDKDKKNLNKGKLIHGTGAGNLPGKSSIPPSAKAKNNPGFRIRFPYLWIFLAIVLVYGNSINFGITHLDDKIFIIENSEYNKDPSNIIHSFKRGVFNEDKDTYYRPILLISYVLEYPMHGQNPQGYHLVNLILHILCAFLLFKFLSILLNEPVRAFIFTLIFALHPVLSQAVVWIPGRNDTMLMLFLLSFLLSFLKFIEKGHFLFYLLQLVFLLLALFTKESAVAAPLMAVLITYFLLKNERRVKKYILPGISWIIAFVCWYYLRSQATLKAGNSDFSAYMDAFIYHAPVIIQYIGKIFFPFNLSVFAMQEDTVYYYGIAAILLLIAFVVPAKNKNLRMIIFGLLWFAAFMGPALLIPKELNEQVFEHRLYIPIIGIFLVLSQSVLFINKLKASVLAYYGIGIALLLGVGSFVHARLFRDEITFWESAVSTSPSSSYAAMLLGVKYYFRERKPESEIMIKRSYALNPKERYTNHYMGKFLLEKDSLDAAERFFKTETRISNFSESWFELAHIAFMKKDLKAAENALSKAVLQMKFDPIVNSNLLLLYLDLKEFDKAESQLEKMKKNGLNIPEGAEERLKKRAENTLKTQ
jgi:tetratricopeptide (TPR) repeat protein